jgi:hypothetical protein
MCGGLRHADELECEVAVRRSADGVADQPGERRMDRHRGAGRPRDERPPRCPRARR